MPRKHTPLGFYVPILEKEIKNLKSNESKLEDVEEQLKTTKERLKWVQKQLGKM